MMGYLAVSIVPLILLTCVTNFVFQREYRIELETGTMDSMEQIGRSLESTMQQCYSIAVQVSRMDAFSGEALVEEPAARIEMQGILRDYRDTNNHLQDIVYYNGALPELFFTAQGSYHSMYYKWYTDRRGDAIPARELYPTLKPIQGMPYADLEVSRISFGPSFDIICRLPNTRDAYLSFSLSRQTIGGMLDQSKSEPTAILLLDADGYPLYTGSRQEEPLEPLIQLQAEYPDRQVIAFTGGEYLLKVNSPSGTFTLVYLLSSKSFYARLIHMRNIMLMLFFALSAVTAVVAFHLTQRQVRPLMELTQLVERVFRTQSDQKYISEFDQIREAILFISGRNEQLMQQSEQQLRENKRLKALVGNMECESKPTDLARSAMDLVDRLLGDSRLNATFVAESLSCSLSNLSHQFKAATGHTLNDYIVAGKLTYACKHLEQTDEPVKDIAERLGYTQSTNFIRIFKSVYGITPSEYRRQRRAQLAELNKTV